MFGNEFLKMDHSITAIVFGGFICLIAILCFFFLLDYLKDSSRRKRRIEIKSRRRVPILKPVKFEPITEEPKMETILELSPDEEADEFKVLIKDDEGDIVVEEEYGTQTQECLAVLVGSDQVVVGLCVFMNDCKIEYFIQEIPECCRQNGDDKANAELRMSMTAISHWSQKWCYAEAVNLLCQDRDLVKAFNTPGTRPNRSLRQFESKYFFKAFPQWTENFICDDVANEDLWESIVVLAKTLLIWPGNESQQAKAWKHFPLFRWARQKVKVEVEHFHLVPHAGKIDQLHKKQKKSVTIMT